MIAEPRVLRDVRFAMLAAFELLPGRYSAFQRGEFGRFIWPSDTETCPIELVDYRAIEAFLIEKQMFFGHEKEMPSFPPDRAVASAPIPITFRVGGRPIQSPFQVIISLFPDQQVICALLYTTFERISIDELIFIKELKWHRSFRSPCIWIGDNQKPEASIYDAIHDILLGFGASAFRNNGWPIFDFIELRHEGPAVHHGPNLRSRLSLQEHWGLLSGDEGYRLIDESEDSYGETLTDKAFRFRGRSYFLYQFFPTSCLAFLSSDVGEIKEKWKKYYDTNVGFIPVVNSYIGLNAPIACLNDGIPLLVEICLLRYITLTRVDRILTTENRLSWLSAFVSRLGGSTTMERAIMELRRLDLYQESALWIVGGSYSEMLFQYNRLRERIDSTARLHQSSLADIRLFTVAAVTLLVTLGLGILALVAKS